MISNLPPKKKKAEAPILTSKLRDRKKPTKTNINFSNSYTQPSVQALFGVDQFNKSIKVTRDGFFIHSSSADSTRIHGGNNNVGWTTELPYQYHLEGGCWEMAVTDTNLWNIGGKTMFIFAEEIEEQVLSSREYPVLMRVNGVSESNQPTRIYFPQFCRLKSKRKLLFFSKMCYFLHM